MQSNIKKERLRKENIMTHQEFLQRIPTIQKISTIFSQGTKMPMLFCHEETMDDYVYVYIDEQAATEKVKELNEKKMPAMVVNCVEKQVLSFLAELRLIGANAVCFVTSKEEGGEAFLVQLTEFLTFPDFSQIPEEKRPFENYSLHLSMLYFMQEVRRPIDVSEKTNLSELEEETSANIAKAKFFLPMNEKLEEGETKRGVVMLKTEAGNALVPLFTDAGELRKFMQGRPCPVATVDFRQAIDLVQNGNSMGIVINPASSNVLLNRQGIASIVNRFLI